MQNFLNKPNTSYWLAGALAITALFIPVAIAAAPYIGFLVPIAALNVNLPLVISCAVLFVVIIAFSSYKVFQNSINATKEIEPVEDQDKTVEEVKADGEELDQNVDTQDKTVEEPKTDNKEQVENKGQGRPVEEPDNQEQVETVKENNTDNKKQNEQRLKQKQPYIKLVAMAGCIIILGANYIAYCASRLIINVLSTGSAMTNVNSNPVTALSIREYY